MWKLGVPNIYRQWASNRVIEHFHVQEEVVFEIRKVRRDASTELLNWTQRGHREKLQQYFTRYYVQQYLSYWYVA